MSRDLSFGELLRRWRVAAELTQEALAARAHISARSVSDLERGVKHTPRPDTVQLLAAALALAPAETADFKRAAYRLGGADSHAVTPETSAPPFVGRASELHLIDQYLTGVGPPVLLLAGEPGIGKSRLLQEAGLRATSGGWQVLSGGCQRRGGQEPYAPMLEALERYLRRQQPARLRQELQDCAWLVRLLPELTSALLDPRPSSTLLPPEQERRLLFTAVARFLINVAGPAGTLLVLDDLQWAGTDALDLLAALARSDAGTRVRLIGAYRDTEVEPRDPLGMLLADLAHAARVTQRSLKPLTSGEVEELLDSLLQRVEGAPALRRRVLQRAGGVPFFLVSCAQGLQSGALVGDTEEGVPWDVAQGLRQRVAALPEVARDVLGVAAVVGRVVPPSLLREVIAQPEPLLLSALDATCRARLLVEAPGEGYLFPHDVIREVVEIDLGLARRAALHRQVAEALESQAGQIPIELVAYHYAWSGKQDRAIDYLVRAAERAYHTLAYREAVDLIAQAIGIAERCGLTDLVANLHVRRGRAFQGAGMYRDAQSELDLAFAALPAQAVEQRAQVQVYLAEVSFWLRDTSAMRRYSSPALILAEAAGRADLAAEAMAWCAESDKADGDLRSSLGRYRQALDRSRKPCLPALVNAPLLFYLIGQNDEAVTLARAGIEAARAVNDALALMTVYPHLGLALAASGRYTEALQVFEEAWRFGRTFDIRDMRSQLSRALAMSIGMHLDLFDFDGAERIAEEARDIARSADWAPTVVHASIDLLFNFTRRQEVGRAARLLNGVTEAAEATSGWHLWLWRLRLAQARAEIALASGRWEDAIELADAAILDSRRRGRAKYQAAGLRTRAQALATGGREKAAITDLREALRLARQLEDPALFLSAATVLLNLDGDDTLAGEARGVAGRMVQGLPEGLMRRRFVSAEPLHILDLARQPAFSDLRELEREKSTMQPGCPA